MKVCELFENDWIDGGTPNLSIHHLSQTEKSRCHEFIVYVQHLISKHPTLSILMRSAHNWPKERGSWFWTWGATWALPEIEKTLPITEQRKFRMKLSAMVDAKRAFEQAGGKYV